MSRRSRNPNFEQTLERLRAHSFDVTPASDVAGGALVSKYGAGAVLVARPRVKAQAPVQGADVAFAVTPGALTKGQVARLLDRGYQKFLQTPQFEIPATASQLEGIHRFAEELKQWTGAIDLYNEALGTTSDLYQYDRLRGREAAPPTARRPWDLTEGH